MMQLSYFESAKPGSRPAALTSARVQKILTEKLPGCGGCNREVREYPAFNRRNPKVRCKLLNQSCSALKTFFGAEGTPPATCDLKTRAASNVTPAF
jgi:hypothetical protein